MDNVKKYKQIIIDNFVNPIGLVKTPPEGNYLTNETRTISCTDKFHIFIKLNGETIEDIKYTGNGCGISKAPISIFAKLIPGLSILEVNKLIDDYTSLINSGVEDESLGDLNAFHNVHNFLNRKDCSIIGVEVIKKLINK